MGRSKKVATTEQKSDFLPPLDRDATILWSSIGIILSVLVLIALYLSARTERQLKRRIRKHMQEPAI